MTRACRPLTAWRRLAAPLCAAAMLVVPAPAAADTCSGLSLGAPASGTTAAGPSAVAVGDFDRDGKLDVATADLAANGISVLLGTGSGLGPATSRPSVSSPTDIVAGDLERDGKLDLVVASGAGAQVAAHQGLAGGSFVTGISSGVTVVPSRLALGDFDRDGFLDLVVVSETSQRIRVLRGRGTMSFASATVLAALDFSAEVPPAKPPAAAAGDFDRDGKLDLAVAQSAAGRVDFFLGDGTGPVVPGTPIPAGTGRCPQPPALYAAHRVAGLPSHAERRHRPLVQGQPNARR